MTLEDECRNVDIVQTADLLETNLALLDEADDPIIRNNVRQLAIHYHELTGTWYYRKILPHPIPCYKK